MHWSKTTGSDGARCQCLLMLGLLSLFFFVTIVVTRRRRLLCGGSAACDTCFGSSLQELFILLHDCGCICFDDVCRLPRCCSIANPLHLILLLAVDGAYIANGAHFELRAAAVFVIAVVLVDVEIIAFLPLLVAEGSSTARGSRLRVCIIIGVIVVE